MTIAPLLIALTLTTGAAPPPAAIVRVSYRGQDVALGADAAARLRADLEEMLAGCSIATPAPEVDEILDLEVAITYAPPRTFATSTPGRPQVELDRIRLAASATTDGGWPLLFGTGPAIQRRFDKCHGGKILDTVCTPELEGLVPPAVRDNCGLAPRRRAAPSADAVGRRES